jgi:hypothetical protein
MMTSEAGAAPPIKESAFSRAWQDTQRVVTGDLRFWVLDVVLSFIVGVVAPSRWWGIGVLLGGPVVIFLRSVIRAPYLQRNEAWRALERAEGERSARPRLQLGPFKREPPFFRESPLMSEKLTAGGQMRWIRIGTGYYVNIQLTNAGPGVVRECQPMVTACGKRSESGGWTRTVNWVPIGLQWVLDEAATQATGAPTEERDLIPQRPYLVNLGTVGTTDPNCFHLLLVIKSFGQESHFQPGEHCFEVTVYSENADPVRRWYRVLLRGALSPHPTMEEALQKLQIEQLDRAPWSEGS